MEFASIFTEKPSDRLRSKSEFVMDQCNNHSPCEHRLISPDSQKEDYPSGTNTNSLTESQDFLDRIFRRASCPLVFDSLLSDGTAATTTDNQPHETQNSSKTNNTPCTLPPVYQLLNSSELSPPPTPGNANSPLANGVVNCDNFLNFPGFNFDELMTSMQSDGDDIYRLLSTGDDNENDHFSFHGSQRHNQQGIRNRAANEEQLHYYNGRGTPPQNTPPLQHQVPYNQSTSHSPNQCVYQNQSAFNQPVPSQWHPSHSMDSSHPNSASTTPSLSPFYSVPTVAPQYYPYSSNAYYSNDSPPPFIPSHLQQPSKSHTQHSIPQHTPAQQKGNVYHSSSGVSTQHQHTNNTPVWAIDPYVPHTHTVYDSNESTLGFGLDKKGKYKGDCRHMGDVQLGCDNPFESVAKTTIMLRNIPNKYTQRMLVDVICYQHGYINCIDFFYLPIDFRNKCNVGYAFINFRTAEAASGFKNHFSGFRLAAFNSNKICQVTWARVQGLFDNVEHYRNSPVNGVPIREYKPILFEQSEDGSCHEVEFPLPDFPLAPVRLRAPKC